MGVPNSEIGYTSAMPRREDHEVHKDMWGQWTKKSSWIMYLIKKHYDSLLYLGKGRWKCDGTHTETRFCLSAKRTSPFKSAEASVQSTTDSRGVRISGSNAGYIMFRGSVRGTGYPLHSLPLPCVTVCHHISTGVYLRPLRFQRNVLLMPVKSWVNWEGQEFCSGVAGVIVLGIIQYL